MKHASAATLFELSPVLAEIRNLSGLTERKPGVFYRGSAAFLHFHEDSSGFFADAKLHGAVFERLPVTTGPQRKALVRAVRDALSSRNRE